MRLVLLLLLLSLPFAGRCDSLFPWYFLEGQIICPDGTPLRNTEVVLRQNDNRRYFKTDKNGYYKVQVWYGIPCMSGRGYPGSKEEWVRIITACNDQQLEFAAGDFYLSIPTRWMHHFLDSAGWKQPVQGLDLALGYATPLQREIFALDVKRRNRMLITFRSFCNAYNPDSLNDKRLSKLYSLLHDIEIRNRSWTELFGVEGLISLKVFPFIPSDRRYELRLPAGFHNEYWLKGKYWQFLLFTDHYAVVHDWDIVTQDNFRIYAPN